MRLPVYRRLSGGYTANRGNCKKAFPQARILRMDADTTKGKDGHAEILRAFGKHEADILIGTQMIVKGHDFPGVTLVGILAADLSLHVSDYRAAERTFQLLTQAAGRAGRGLDPGEVVIQTYDPEHYAITCAARQDYTGFYTQEMAYRRMAGYPPAGKKAGHMQGGGCPGARSPAPGQLRDRCAYTPGSRRPGSRGPRTRSGRRWGRCS